MMYVPLTQSAGLDRPADTGVRISVRATSEPGSVARSLAAALTAVSADLTFSFRPLADDIDGALARERLVATLSGLFGALAAFLAALGLYGVTAYTATQRRTELAIRMALGARRAEVIRLVVRRALGLTVVGITVGLAIAAALTRYLEALLFGVTPLDPMTFVVVALFFIGIAVVAAYLPASHASKVDPMAALRAE